jgi:hypothetical protein
LNFQYSIISDYITNNDLEIYLKYATGKKLNYIKQFRPKLLIAPYFYLNPHNSDFENWLKINMQFLQLSASKINEDFNGIQLFGQIVINKDVLLDKKVMQTIVNEYNQCDCTGFAIWVDGLDEHEADLNILNGFIEFLQGLKGKPIYNLYGGFFSILLTHQSIKLLNGVSHGLEYGESREVYPVGGGIPVSKYYYMPLHQRKDFTKAFYLLEHNNILDRSLQDWGDCKKYFDEICQCEQCHIIMENAMINFVKFESNQYYEIKRQNSITRRKKASAETKENCLYHYLLCKKTEFVFVKNHSIGDLLDKLQEEKSKYTSCPFIDDKELNYIDNWCKVISMFCKS